MLFPEPGRAGDGDQQAERESDVDRFQVVLAGPADDERLAVAAAPLCRRRDRALPRQELPGRRLPASEDVFQRPLHDDGAAVNTGPGSHFDDVIGGPDRVLVVLDDDDRVADVAQAFERGDHLRVVFRMQADARLVEHVQHAHETGSDLRREPDPLRLTARERSRAPIETEVIETDAKQKLQPAADLFQHLAPGVGVA